MIDVEKNVPMPEPTSSRTKLEYPSEHMEIGDSFFVDNSTIQKVCNANNRAKKKYGAKFMARREEGGIRVWRMG